MKKNNFKRTVIEFCNPTDKNGKAENCNCRIEISDGRGIYSDSYTVYLCRKHRRK